MLCAFFAGPRRAPGSKGFHIRQVFEILCFEEGRARILVLVVVESNAKQGHHLIVGHRGGVGMSFVEPPWGGTGGPTFLPADALRRVLDDQFKNNEEGRIWFRPRLSPYDTVAGEWIEVRRWLPEGQLVLGGPDSWCPYTTVRIPSAGEGSLLLAVEMSLTPETYDRLVGDKAIASDDGPKVVLDCIEHIDLADPKFGRVWHDDLASLKENLLVPDQYEIGIAKPSLGFLPVRHYNCSGDVVRGSDRGGKWLDRFVAVRSHDFSLGLTFPGSPLAAELV